jgi:hypothetical protein
LQQKEEETAMKDCTKQLLLFKDISHKKIEADFEGGEVSSDAGLLFLREVENRIGLISKMTDSLKDRRHPGYVKHQLHELFKQRIFQIACGYEDGNDSDELRHDPVMKIACERLPEEDPALASQPTISRFENSLSKTELFRIGDAFIDTFIDSYSEPPEGIILDIDDTDDITHGRQQLSLFNAYHGDYCYMPIHIYEGKSGKLITTVLRPGKRPSGREIVSILKRVVKKIRQAWPEVGILLRGDAHYSCPEVFDFCEDNDTWYVLGFKSLSPLVRQVQPLVNEVARTAEQDKRPVKRYTELLHKAQSWEKARRVIAKVEHTMIGPNLRFIITNLEHWNLRFIYQTVYCGRGAMELMIKEHKNHLLSDRTSCTSFTANQFRLFLHSAAYVLLHTFRTLHLKGTEWASAQFDTIRLKIIKIGARIIQLTRKIRIHLPTSYPWKKELRKILLSCCAAGDT